MIPAKKTLLLIIDSLVKGGAEVMLVGLLPELKEKFEVILVTLSDKCAFKKDELRYDHRYSLGFKNKYSLPACILSLRSIIKKHSPHLIHSHLIYSSLIARIACPASVPLLFSIHGELSKSDFNNSRVLTFLEKITLRQNHALLAVSQVALKDYEKTIGKVINKFILHNYIANEFLDAPSEPRTSLQARPLRLMAVGNVKAAKNYAYAIGAFSYLKEYPVTLDIYGDTHQHLYQELQDQIDHRGLKISFKGVADDVREKMKHYDVFLMSSKNEGFGIAVIEAMACGLPLLLSDIPVMREITASNALFFNLDDPKKLANLLKEILEGKHATTGLTERGQVMAKVFNKKSYAEKLFGIYNKLIPYPVNP